VQIVAGKWRRQVDPATFREVLGSFPSGVTIVTTTDLAGTPVGLTATAVASVSIEPPQLLVCLASGTYTLQSIRHTGRFVVNILASDQVDLSTRFASRGGDKFANLVWAPGSNTRAPILTGCLATAECEVDQVVPSGDHTVVIGRIVEGHARPGSPLLYHARRYASWPEPDGDQ
jgi:flavin reductase (DIM6/NTAB) family NADH-FMN oxidoreductase RutF